jgi:RNA polymerase sigma-70 factor (ECF subfamily)
VLPVFLNVAAEALAVRGAPLSAADRQRLSAMYDAHRQVVWRVLRRSGLERAQADDAAQQVFLVALRRLGELDPSTERGFLCGTAVMVARKLKERGGREEPVELVPDGESRDRPDHQAEHRRNLALLDRLLKQLPAELRDVFVLQEIEGLSKRETALALELPEGTVASRLRRARETFEGLLAAATGGAP